MKLLLGAVCGLFCLVGSSRAQSGGKTSSSILDSNSRAVVTDRASDLIRNYYRLTMGGGGGLFADDGGFAGGLFGSFQRGHSVFTLGFLGTGSYQGTIDNKLPAGQSVTEYDLLYGYGFVRGSLFFSLSAGISYNAFDLRGAHLRDSVAAPGTFPSTIQIYDERKTVSWGVPLQLQLMFDFSSVIGVGVLYFWNINPKEFSSGLLVCIQVGWF